MGVSFIYWTITRDLGEEAKLLVDAKLGDEEAAEAYEESRIALVGEAGGEI